MRIEITSARRQFIQNTGILSSSLMLSLPLFSSCRFTTDDSVNSSALTFGIVADIHADLIPDKMERLESFIETATQKDVDFIIQLGDFCFPKKENLEFLHLWNQFKKPKYHVLGNHDMDVSSKSETMDFWGMSNAYYSFDQKGLHFVVLDPNYLFQNNKYLDYDHANFYVDDATRTFINPEQISWLIEDLKNTDLPTIIFSHQSLINPIWGIKNRVEVQHILESENSRVGHQKIIACFNGHDHIDFHRQINGIHYLEINSMSYQWLGEKYSNKTRYPEHFYKTYQHLDKLGTYKDPLFAFATLDLEDNLLRLDGVQSEWVTPTPAELHVPTQVFGAQSSASISNREIQL